MDCGSFSLISPPRDGFWFGVLVNLSLSLTQSCSLLSIREGLRLDGRIVSLLITTHTFTVQLQRLYGASALTGLADYTWKVIGSA